MDVKLNNWIVVQYDVRRQFKLLLQIKTIFTKYRIVFLLQKYVSEDGTNIFPSGQEAAIMRT
jgi:hypothetical protein